MAGQLVFPRLKIVSGGQTGADRAALDFAISHGIPYGGWCPKGRRALDGPLDTKYLLTETPKADYLQRNEWNVRDSDATVVFTLTSDLGTGSKKTLGYAKKYLKPSLHLVAADSCDHGGALGEFLREHVVQVLNIAGSRGDGSGELEHFVTVVLAGALLV